MFKKAVLDTLYKWQSSQFSGQRLPRAGGAPAQRGVQCGHLAGAEEGGGRELLLSFCWLLWKDLPREGALSLGGSFPTCVCSATKGVYGIMALEGEVYSNMVHSNMAL